MEILRLLSINCFCHSSALKMWRALWEGTVPRAFLAHPEMSLWYLMLCTFYFSSLSFYLHVILPFPLSSPTAWCTCLLSFHLPLNSSVSPFLLPHTVTPLALHVLLPGTPHNQDHSGTLGPEEFKACLISLGYDIGNDAQVLNASGEHRQMLNCEKITGFSFLFLFVLIHLSLLFLCLTIYTTLFCTTSSLNVLWYLFLLNSLIVCLGTIPFMSSNNSIYFCVT